MADLEQSNDKNVQGDLDLQNLEQEKDNLKNDIQKFQQMSTNAKRLTGFPSGQTAKAQNYDKQVNVNNSMRYREDLNATLLKIKDIDKRILDKKKEIEQNKKDTLQTEQKKMAKLNKRDIVRLLESQEPARMTKRDLVESISHLILREGMHDDVRRKIDSGDNDYAGHLDPETVKRMADALMNDISGNLQGKMGGRGQVNQDAAQRVLYQGLGNALQKEDRHKEELEQLAVKLVREEFDVPEDAVDFDVKIMGQQPIHKTGLKMRKGTTRPPQGKTEEELKPNVTKRRLMNAMMHGAARKGQNLFHMASEELNNIAPGLVDDYSKIMAGNDFMYWSMSDDSISQESEGGTHAGQVRVDLSGPKPKIIAQGMTFPFLLHELTKGVLELMSLHGLDADKETRDFVLDKTDNLESEPWDIRLGPKIWEKFMEALEVDDLPYKSQIFNQLSVLPPAEFNSVVHGLLNDTDQAKSTIRDMAHDVRREMGEEALDNATSQYRDEDYGNEEGGDTATPDGEDEDREDPVLKGLLGKKDEPEVDDMNNWSKRELEDARDEALDTEDYGLVRQIQNILDKKY